MRLSTALLDLLACPVTKDKLIYNEGAQELISIKAKLAYSITDTGIPILLANEARKLSHDEIVRYTSLISDNK